MIDKIANQIEHWDGCATLVADGPSSDIEALQRLSAGLLISINNAIEAPYNFLVDAIEAEGGEGIYPEVIEEKVDGLFFRTKPEGKSRGPLSHGFVNRDFPTDSKALAFAVKHGARRIRLIGFDYFNPWNRSRNFIGADEADLEDLNRFKTLPMKMLRDVPGEKEWERYRRRKTLLEISIEKLKSDHNAEFYNLSPVSNIRGAKRLDAEA